MKNAPILLVLGAGALAGWLAPDLSDDAAAPAAQGPAADSEPAERLAALQRDQWLAGEVVLPRAADGHFYADVSVDGETARMLVDTGATMVALTAADADALGVAWDPAEVRPVARGASGLVHGVSVVLEHVQVGELEARAVEAVVVPEGLGVSLLGQSFLSQIERVEMERDTMVLGG